MYIPNYLPAHLQLTQVPLITLLLLGNLHHQFPQLFPTLHILKQALNALQILHSITARNRPRHQWAQIFRRHKSDHVGEFSSGSHRGAAEFEIFEHRGHAPGEFGGGRHSVLGDDAAVLGIDWMEEVSIGAYGKEEEKGR